MDKKTQSIYFDFINKITKHFYFSIWDKTKNWHSGGIFKRTERLDFNKGDYNIPKNWDNTFKKNFMQIFEDHESQNQNDKQFH